MAKVKVNLEFEVSDYLADFFELNHQEIIGYVTEVDTSYHPGDKSVIENNSCQLHIVANSGLYISIKKVREVRNERD